MPFSFDIIAVELLLLAVGFLILFLDMFFISNKKWLHILSVLSFFIAIFWLVTNFFLEKKGFYGFLSINSWNSSIKILLLIASCICIVLSPPILKKDGIYSAEFYFLFHIVLVSILLLISSLNLFFIYICLETASISSFILCSLNKNNPFAIEGGMKYFLLNAFSSAILLYGIALIFGATGSFFLEEIYTGLSATKTQNTMALLGIFFLVVGFGFKISLVPFHMWAPDVYSSSSLTITAFFSVPMKIAFIAVFIKVCMLALIPYFQFLQILLGIILALTLLVSNTLALVQKDIKRIIAYSSISHAGFLILAAFNIPIQGIASLYFYIFSYIFASLGVFTCLIYLSGKKDHIQLDDLRGLAIKHPIVCSVFMFFLFSLAGLPVTAGFIAKLTLFYDALKSGYFGLVAIGLLASTISAGYYLKIGINFFSKPLTTPIFFGHITFSTKFILFICVAVLFVLGVYPSLLDWNIELIQGKLPHPFL